MEKYTIIWSVLGDVSLFPPRIIGEGNPIGELPIPKIECEGKVFYGWSETPMYDDSTEPPTLINEKTIPQTSTTYYAVFAEKIQKVTWERTDIDKITSRDEVIITMKIYLNDTFYYYALPTNQENSNPLALEVKVEGEYITNNLLSETIRWNIDKNDDEILTIHPSNMPDKWLYVDDKDHLKVGTKTINSDFKIQNDFLCCTTDYTIGINFSIKNDIVYWYWYAVKQNNFYNQQICFFKKNDYTYHNFTTFSNEYTSLSLQIIEWKQDAIVVMYNGDPNQQAKIYINGNAQGEYYTLSKCQKDEAIYEIPILPILGLASHTNQQLDIIIADQKKTCIIPLIITEEISTNELVNLSSNTDVIIQKGGILTLNSAEIKAQTWGNVTIYGGGKIIIGSGCIFNASTIIMRIGSIENCEYHAAYPQFILQGQLGTVSNIYIDYLTTYDRYYALSLPYEVNTIDIHYPIDIYGENVSPDNKGSFTLQYYDGASRALEGIGWKDLPEPATLNPYKGYTFWGAPKNVSVNGAEKVRQQFGIHRLPIHNINTINETETKNISVIAHGNEQTNDNDRGWNFLGNPYLGEYTGTIGDIRYITQTNDGKKYFSNEVSNVTLDPFNTYFVQVNQDQTLSFNMPNSSYIQSPQKEVYHEISTGIQLSCMDIVDRVGILIADRYTENYDFNADLAKFDNHDLSSYAISDNGNLSYIAINSQTAEQSIRIGYKVSENAHLTFQFDDSRYDAKSINKLFLIDKELNVKTDLLQTNYSFYSDAGNFDQRFALEIQFHDGNATNVSMNNIEPNIILEPQCLKISNVSLDTRISIFNVLGHCFYQQIAASSELAIQLPRGYYIIHINCAIRTVFIP